MKSYKLDLCLNVHFVINTESGCCRRNAFEGTVGAAEGIQEVIIVVL